MNKIKTYNDACKFLKINSKNLPDVSMLDKKEGRQIVAFYKLGVIVRALNGDWKPNYSNNNQAKYYPYFRYEDGTFSYDYWIDYLCTSSVGARLSYRSAELAEYAGKQFIKFYNELLKPC